MGTSRSRLLEAEEKLLRAGISWWEADGRRMSGQEGQPAGAISLNCYDEDIGDGEVLHTAEYRYHANGDDDEQRKTDKSGAAGQTGEPKVDTGTQGTALVVMHGYCAGIGSWFSSLPGLCEWWARQGGGPIFALDWFGCGLSSRPSWEGGFGDDADAEKTEALFIDALERWRQSKWPAGRIVLMGHSLGGFLSCCYAEKYGGEGKALAGLLCISPVGIPEPSASMVEQLKNGPWWLQAVGRLWEDGVGPFQIVRGGSAKWMLDGYVRRRFKERSWITPDLKELLSKYLYANICCGKISAGGYAHSTLLRPGAFAKRPLCHRLPAILQTDSFPVHFVYGTTDWMDWNHAADVLSAMPGNKAAETVRVLTVEDSDHNLMIDNPLGLVEAIRRTGIRPTAAAAAAAAAAEGKEEAGNALAPGATVGFLPLYLETGLQLESGSIVLRQSSSDDDPPPGLHSLARPEHFVDDRRDSSQRRRSGLGADEGRVDRHNGDGTFRVQWGDGTTEGAAAGHRLRPKPPPEPPKPSLWHQCSGDRLPKSEDF